MAPRIRLWNEVCDRLKAQASAAGRRLEEHRAYLADDGDRAERFAALRRAIDATPAEAMASYRHEVAAWESTVG